MGLIGAIIIGFFVGLIARFLKPGDDRMGFIATTVLGIVGAVVGTYQCGGSRYRGGTDAKADR